MNRAIISELKQIEESEDIRKALKLFQKSNPPLLEWLQSPLVYLEKFSLAQKMRELSPMLFSPKSCLYHYLHMAEGNFREYLKGEQVKVKKYFYVLRPILACRWIERYNSMPPMEFKKLLDTVLDEDILREEIRKLLKRKEAGEELDIELQIRIINEFVEDQIGHFRNSDFLLKNPLRDHHSLDKLFQDTLEEVWDTRLPTEN